MTALQRDGQRKLAQAISNHYAFRVESRELPDLTGADQRLACVSEV